MTITITVLVILVIGTTYKYKIADIIWEISPQNIFSEKMLEDYKVSCDKSGVVIPAQKGNSAKEYQNILECLNYRLVRDFDGIMIHAAAIVYNDKGYLFAAPSGTGKTTHISLWQQHFRDEIRILNGDKPFIRYEDGDFYVYGSPWQGKENLGYNGRVKLGGIYILERAKQNSICKADSHQVLNGLIKSVLIENNIDDRLKTLDLLNRISGSVPVHLLYCNTQADAAYITKQHIDSGVQ